MSAGVGTCNMQWSGLGPECVHFMKHPNGKEVRPLTWRPHVSTCWVMERRTCAYVGSLTPADGSKCDSARELAAILFRKQKRRAVQKTIPPHSPIATIYI